MQYFLHSCDGCEQDFRLMSASLLIQLNMDGNTMTSPARTLSAFFFVVGGTRQCAVMSDSCHSCQKHNVNVEHAFCSRIKHSHTHTHTKYQWKRPRNKETERERNTELYRIPSAYPTKMMKEDNRLSHRAMIAPNRRRSKKKKTFLCKLCCSHANIEQ